MSKYFHFVPFLGYTSVVALMYQFQKTEMLPSKPNPKKTMKITGEPVMRFDRVLVIDDSDVDFFTQKTLLINNSISNNIERELSPEIALKKIKKAQKLEEIPDIIMLGINDGKNEAYSFLQDFNKLSDFIKKKCKIVVISNSSELDDKYRALLNPNVVRYLAKPLDAIQLKDFIVNS